MHILYASRIFFCDHKVPIRPKGKFYHNVIHMTILYVTDCWTLKGQHERKMGVVKMSMFRWI